MIFRGKLRWLPLQRTGKDGKLGPHLWDVLGRDKASLPKATHSKALLAWEGVWTYDDLNTYLYGPTLTTPGVFMETPGVPDTERVHDRLFADPQRQANSSA